MVQLRCFQKNGAWALADLTIEMAVFCGAVIDPDLVIAGAVIHQSQKMDIVVAHDDTELLGFATYASLHPVRGLPAVTYVQRLM